MITLLIIWMWTLTILFIIDMWGWGKAKDKNQELIKVQGEIIDILGIHSKQVRLQDEQIKGIIEVLNMMIRRTK